MAGDWYTFGVALFAAIGTFLFGFDTGIATTTIAHESWIEYMGHPSEGLTGAVVAVYIAGEACGALTQTFLGDRLGRIRFMQMMCVVVTIGTVIQTAAVNMGMFLAGRALAGYAVGGLVGTVPIYLSEISSPHQRGLIGGISGCGISFGTMASNWVGMACGYAPYGATQWRLPLGIQIPWGIILFIGLATFMPNSPRLLIRKGKIEPAREEFLKIRRDLQSHEALEEFALMHAQIEYEMEREITSYSEIFKLFRHRALVSIAVQTMTSLTGVNVIQYYQTILYKSLGIDQKTILALAGVYGTIAFLSNALTTRFLTDQWGRRKMILTGLAGIIVIEIYAAVMQLEFQNSDNRIGKGFAVLGIYLFVVTYYGMLNSTTWLYGAEVLPMALRSKVMGLAAASHFIVNVGITEAGPSAFANIKQNYYYVFVGCTAFFLTIAWFYFPETRHKTLEEVAAAFGDRVVSLTDRDLVAEQTVFEEKVAMSHVEKSDADADRPGSQMSRRTTHQYGQQRMPGDIWDKSEDDWGMPVNRRITSKDFSIWSPRRHRRSWPYLGFGLLVLIWWMWPASTAVDWSRYAYVTYATNDANMCNAFMMFESLHRLGSKADRVLLHNPQWIDRAQGGMDRNAQLMSLAAKRYNVKLRPARLLDERGEHTEVTSDGISTWDTSVTKLRAFELTEYDRVLHIDSDSTILQHMDELFLAPKAPIAMPRAYWTDEVVGRWPLTSLMMLIEPNPLELRGMLDTLRSWWMDQSPDKTHGYDMELLNQRFGASAMVLPHRPYALLTSEFRNTDHSAYLGTINAPAPMRHKWDPDAVLKEAKLVHFSDWPLPKPWVMWPHDAVTEIQPNCTKMGSDSYQYSCREREIWKDLYNDFRKRRKDHCRLLSATAPNWPSWKKTVGAE
ncbi:MFS transporter [Hortaea werneckii]|uniref:Major facilitator superfamily (MFS) profile domain-containing protein n=2 Tax=Hortaea werneckii TaxID=91943 RepID=A0A1Z5TUS2_HORWE|nr:MFS transporter [Hortaea werneckii]OTA39661.1 hypothetical protein BTJ68_00410 [Hortaea werneckii EXF-2000]KAI6852554.1 MFS transporter [Hortaea werneckii]KAI6944817.1 MFS transporter [Hortaea werneckii]KAI6951138.1 MFS transporter [Hortaea werneckii]